MTFAPQPKPRPRLLDKRDAVKATEAEERRQRAICRKRSGGICEVAEVGIGRCHRRAVHNHHLLGGIGQRNVGRSILAAHRIDTCDTCHREIHGHVLQPVGEFREYAANVIYERVR